MTSDIYLGSTVRKPCYAETLKGHNMPHYKFWMVYAEGGNSPNKQHFVEAEAVAEAHRLAKKNGRPAYVLESKMGYEVPEPLVVKFATSEAQPIAESY